MVRDGDRCAWHLYVVLVADPGGTQRKQVFDCLRSAGIGVNVHYIPIHTQPYYQGLGFRAGDFPEAERYFRRAITLPLHPTLTEAEQDHVVQTLSEALRG